MQASILQLQRDAQTSRQLAQAQETRIQEQELQLQQQDEQVKRQIQNADAKTSEVSAALSQLNRAARMSDADIGVQIERLIKELQQLRGEAELASYRVGSLEKYFDEPDSVLARIEVLEVRLTDDIESNAAKNSNEDDNSTGQDAPKKDADGSEQKPKQLLEEGAALVESGDIDNALGVYRTILKRWPKEPGVADEAFFRIGEVYYQSSRYRAALQEYIQVADSFPSGRFADDSYYRIGLCSMELGNLEDAKIFLGEVVKSYPRSPLVKLAKGKLRDIKKRLAAEKKAAKKKSSTKSNKKRAKKKAGKK